MLLETLKIENGTISNLSYHQARCDQSRQSLWGINTPLDLASLIKGFPKKGLIRCRICYGQEIERIEYLPYTPKKIETLKIVSSDICYDFKYANRDALNALLAHQACDEVIIEKEGLLTDTTISNLAFYDGRQWFTPSKPLLHGTMRAKLLDEGFLHTREISKEALNRYSHVALMNAMIGFKPLNKISIR